MAGALVTYGGPNPADFTNRLQTYLNPKLMKALEYNLVIAAYGQRQSYPINGLTMRFFRPRAANTTGVGAVTEGGLPANLTEVAVGYVDITLAQRGALAKITDIVLATDLLNTMDLYTKTMGADAALDLDTVVRDTIIAGLLARTAANTHALYTVAGGYFERFAGVTITADPVADYTSLQSATAANSKMTRAVHLGCVTQLKSMRVPKIGGKYVVIAPPETLHDMRQDTTWVSAATQVDTPNLYKDGQFALDGAIFVEHNNAFKEAHASARGTYSASGTVLSNLYLGEGAFGVPELSNKKAGGSPFSPRWFW